MSTLVSHPSLLDAAREPVDGRGAVRPPQAASLCEPAGLRTQVRDFLFAAGLAKMDIALFMALYAAGLILMLLLTLGARIGHPQAWRWGMELMNAPLAAAGLGLLLAGTAAATLALRLSGRRAGRLMTLTLIVAALCCLGYLTTLALDLDTKSYYGIRSGAALKPNSRYLARRFGVKLPKKAPRPAAVAAASLAKPPRVVDAASGRKLFLGTCASCHGPYGQGLPGQGKPLAASTFIMQKADPALLDFVKVGRASWDPDNTTKVQMPPRGGNPMLTDADLRDVVAYLRTLQPAATGGDSPANAAATSDAAAASAAAAGDAMTDIDAALLAPRWVVDLPQSGPAGLSPEALAEQARTGWQPPRDAAAFVDAYWMTGLLGGAYGAAVALALLALAVSAARGRITPDRRAPLALGVAACWGLAAFWTVVFPFAYLV